MDRREALALTTSFLGATLVGSQVFLGACSAPAKGAPLLSAADVPLLNALADGILPDSESSPGAGKAGVGNFIKAIVSECYSPEEETRFVEGLRGLEAEMENEYGKAFTELAAPERLAVLTRYDADARRQEAAGDTPFYSMLLQLTLWGYFISEPGATQALRYNPIPGRYEGCVPYNEGDKAWA